MIIELVDFDISDPDDFEAAMTELVPVISASPGYRGHTVQRSIESPNRYVLFVRWVDVEAHTVGFRQSPDYQRWLSRVANHRDGIRVEHLDEVLTNGWDLYGT